MNYKVVIIDDEDNSLALSEIMLERYCPDFRLAGKAKTIDKAIALIEEHEADVVLLDINMTNESGFDLLKKYPPYNYEVVFLTAHAEHAIKAFKTTAIDYLLKPLAADDLMRAMSKVKTQRNLTNTYNRYKELHKIIEQKTIETTTNEGIKKVPYAVLSGYKFINVEEILYIEADAECSYTYTTKNEKILMGKNIGHYVSMLLDNDNFFKTHRSYLVNLDFVDSFITIDGLFVTLGEGVKVPVSKINKKPLSERLNI